MWDGSRAIREEDDTPFAGKTALLLGSGGVAKALAFGFARREAKVVITGIECTGPTPAAQSPWFVARPHRDASLYGWQRGR